MTYTLASSPMVYTPGILAWAIAMAHTSPAKAAKLISECYGLPADIARRLVTRKLPYEIEGESVVFTVEG